MHHTQHRQPNTWTGRPLRRFEDRRLLTGGGRYVDDVVVPEALSVAVYRSPYPHARLVSIEVEPARRAPGVIDVITGQDVLGLGAVEVGPFVPGVKKPHHALLAAEVARFSGEPVAAVLATSALAARDAVDLIQADW